MQGSVVSDEQHGFNKTITVYSYCPTGDPTFFGNLPVHQVMKEAVKEAVDSDNFNGYGPAHGTTVYRVY